MKKAVILSLISIIALKTFAQSTSGSTQKLHFGLKASPSLAWLRTDSKDLESDGTKFAFNYGLIPSLSLLQTILLPQVLILPIGVASLFLQLIRLKQIWILAWNMWSFLSP